MDDIKDSIDRIETKVDKVVEHVSSIDVTLAVNTNSLIEHMRRTAILENEMKPVKDHVSMVNGVFKFIMLLAALGAGVEGIMFLLRMGKL